MLTGSSSAVHSPFFYSSITLVLILAGVVIWHFYNTRKKQKENDQRFKKLVENAKDIIYTTDAKGHFDFINDATIENTGYSKEELLGNNYKLLVREDHKHKIEAFYKKQIKEKVKESYKEFPFTTKSGKTLWVGQSVLFKYNENTNAYIGAQIICRDVTERVLIEEQLKLHNSDLKVINRVKEIILSSNETTNMYVKILLLLGANSDKSNFFTINIFDKFQSLLHTYLLNTKDQSVQNISKRFDPTLVAELNTTTKTLLQFDIDLPAAELYTKLNQPVELYKSAVIVPIMGADKLFGFIGFYSEQANAYKEDHVIMVKDIATSLSSFFVQYEQRQIINDYSKQLEILNESKKRLISYTNLNDVYKGIIDLLYEEIKNVYRVSILIHDLEKNIGNLIFKDLKSPEISSKIIGTKNVPTIEPHLTGSIFEKQDLDTATDLSDEDLLWKSKGIKSIISLPIMIDGKLFASVNLLSPKANNFSDQQKALIKEINESAAIVIEQLQFKEIISEKNKDISDNINYARRIQNALMPSEELLHQILPQSLLIFKQRDSLGGDFYWYDKIGDTIFLTVGDCTGHGVSGSLLTILATDYIKQAVEVKKFTDPGLILEHVRNAMQATLNKYNTTEEILDGLDISFGVYNTKTQMFLYASAMHTFYLIRDNELMEYKGNRKPIGGSAIMETSYYFTTHLFQLQKNDMVYFTTDGYVDQMEQKTEKRYGKARFKQTLLQICDNPVDVQKQILLDDHLKWKGTSSQTDDICLLGFKIS